MTPRTRTRVGLVWVTMLAGLFTVHSHALGAVPLVSASLPSPSAPAVPAPVPPAIQPPTTPVRVAPPAIQPPTTPLLSPIHLAPAPVSVPALPPVSAAPSPIHLPPAPVSVPALPPVSVAPSPIHLPPPVAGALRTTSPTSGLPAGKGLAPSQSIPPRSAATATSGSQTNTAAASWQSSAGAPSPFSGYGSSGGPIILNEATSHALRRLSRHERARVLSLIAAVRRLQACLSNLPDPLRVVLELATGVNAPRTLSSTEIAHYLRIRVGQVSSLERRALRQLRLTAREHVCNRAQQTTSGVSVLSGFGPVLGDGIATGGVEAARYANGPSTSADSSSTGASPNVDTLLGIDGPPSAGDTWLIILSALAGSLLIGFLFADEERRSRWLRRPPR
jgi:DNA-binding CsgD family transcriptional regulator